MAGPQSTRQVITDLLLELTYRWSRYPYIETAEEQEEERRQMREAFEVLRALMDKEHVTQTHVCFPDRRPETGPEE